MIYLLKQNCCMWLDLIFVRSNAWSCFRELSTLYIHRQRGWPTTHSWIFFVKERFNKKSWMFSILAPTSWVSPPPPSRLFLYFLLICTCNQNLDTNLWAGCNFLHYPLSRSFRTETKIISNLKGTAMSHGFEQPLWLCGGQYYLKIDKLSWERIILE